MKENELITIRDGLPTLSEQVEILLNQYTEAKEQIETAETELRSAILHAMEDNSIFQAKVGKYVISLIVPKKETQFDVDSFLLNENEDIVKAMTETTETSSFDIDSFMKDYPQLYLKYQKKDYVTNVNEKKLSDTFPNIYTKYVTELPSKKKTSIRIVKSKK